VVKPYETGSFYYGLRLISDVGIENPELYGLTIEVLPVDPFPNITLSVEEPWIDLEEGQFTLTFSTPVMFLDSQGPAYQEIRDLFEFNNSYTAITNVTETQIMGTVYYADQGEVISVSVRESEMVLSQELVDNSTSWSVKGQELSFRMGNPEEDTDDTTSNSTERETGTGSTNSTSNTTDSTVEEELSDAEKECLSFLIDNFYSINTLGQINSFYKEMQINGYTSITDDTENCDIIDQVNDFLEESDYKQMSEEYPLDIDTFFD
jgi:hypothetical protein